MSNREADEAARYIEAMQERVGKLCDYVREAAGDESCIVSVASLDATRVRAERAEAAARDFAEAAKDVVKVWREPPKIDSPTDLDSAIDELAIGLARHEQFARGDSGSGSMASTPRPPSTERNQGER